MLAPDSVPRILMNARWIMLFIGTLVTITPTQAQLDPKLRRIPLPGAIKTRYQRLPNPEISDDFNGQAVDVTAKWDYRADNESDWGADPSFVSIKSHGGDRYLSLKGSKSAGRGSGIVTRKPVKYGFYQVRWQVWNIHGRARTGWHPAIWGAGSNFAAERQSIAEVLQNRERLEVDFMEGFHGTKPTWDSHVLMWNRKGHKEKRFSRRFLTKTDRWPNGGEHWVTMGFEYTSTYMALWVFDEKDRKWERHGLVWFASDVGKAFRTDLYWILSIKKSEPKWIERDAWLRVDYFYWYLPI